MSIYFSYDEEILADFTAITAGVIIAKGINNSPTSENLKQLFFAQQAETIDKIGDTLPSEIKSLAAWRGAFRKFGVNPTKYRSAPEALLRRLTKKGDVPSINTLVDIGNLISLRYQLPTAIFDTRQVLGGIRVHNASGQEKFTPLFENVIKHPNVGEVVFSDEKAMVLARRWCWRQSDQSAAKEDTSNAIIVVEAQHENSAADVQHAINDWIKLLQEYCGGNFKCGMLSAKTASIAG